MFSRRWTVSELTRELRQVIEKNYRFQDVEIEGEVSDFRVPGSGHAYFTLKDQDAQLRCVMWRSDFQTNSFRPAQGDRIIAYGYIGIYEAGGQYQLYCRRLEPAGLGDLHARFETLKAQLQAEGLFNSERKQAIPEKPHTIGIVTSPEAAALQDVLNVLIRRYPIARVLLAPATVQGSQAPPQIIAALDALHRQGNIDVILLVRGGGSIEDLWCFNDESVARAVAASRIPVISGIGHETDFTMVDFVADLRAPTPSAAAELATPITIDDLYQTIHALRERASDMAGNMITGRYRHFQHLSKAMSLLSPLNRVCSLRQQVDTMTGRMLQAVTTSISLRKAHLDGIMRALSAVNPRETLERGYAIVQQGDGTILHSAAGISPGDRLDIYLHRGAIRTTVDEVELDNDQETGSYI
nr:exodeoxyribonuclease VII large subunit [Anaerolineae bacterium]